MGVSFEEYGDEIASSFVMQESNIPYDQQHIQNHKAYIQSWIKVLKNDKTENIAQRIKTAKAKASTQNKSTEVQSKIIPQR